ncbi:MAG: hypothetical protein Q9180_009577, partial [Flavoplaca navasiana]
SQAATLTPTPKKESTAQARRYKPAPTSMELGQQSEDIGRVNRNGAIMVIRRLYNQLLLQLFGNVNRGRRAMTMVLMVFIIMVSMVLL